MERLSVKQVSEMLGMSLLSVRGLAAAGKIPCFIIGDEKSKRRTYIFHREVIEDFLKNKGKEV